MKQLSDYLPKKYSFWQAKNGMIIALNDTVPTKENLRIIFWCEHCKEYHVAKLEDIKQDDDENYDLTCPKSYKLGEFQDYIYEGDIPEILRKIFQECTFETNY